MSFVESDQSDRQALWRQWQQEFKTIERGVTIVRSTAQETKKAAKTYQAIVSNAIEVFTQLKDDFTVSAIDWDYVDFNFVSKQAYLLNKLSMKAYKQCKNEVNMYIKMQADNLKWLLKAEKLDGSDLRDFQDSMDEDSW